MRNTEKANTGNVSIQQQRLLQNLQQLKTQVLQNQLEPMQ